MVFHHVQNHPFPVAKCQQKIGAGNLLRQRFNLGQGQLAHQTRLLAPALQVSRTQHRDVGHGVHRQTGFVRAMPTGHHLGRGHGAGE